MRYRFSDTQPGRFGRKLHAVDELDAGPRIFGKEQVAVQVDVVEEARDLRAGRDGEARFVHAAQHHPEPERAARVDDPHCLADAAGFGELDRQPVCALGAGRDVFEHVEVLVDVNRERRAALQLRAPGIARGERLLAVLDAELLELRNGLERLVQRPELVHVHLERDVTNPAHGADALDVEAVAPAELQLQAFEASADILGAARHVVRIAEPDRPGSRRADAPEAATPSCGIPTPTAPASSEAPREMTKVSAIRSVAGRASSSTPIP